MDSESRSRDTREREVWCLRTHSRLESSFHFSPVTYLFKSLYSFGVLSPSHSFSTLFQLTPRTRSNPSFSIVIIFFQRLKVLVGFRHTWVTGPWHLFLSSLPLWTRPKLPTCVYGSSNLTPTPTPPATGTSLITQDTTSSFGLFESETLRDR